MQQGESMAEYLFKKIKIAISYIKKKRKGVKIMYEKKKSIIKGAEPAIIIPIAEAAEKIALQYGLEIPEGIIYPVVIVIYGAVKGIINAIKNRKK